MIAGGGLKMGQAIGASTDKGERPKDRPFSVPQVLSTIYRADRHRPGDDLPQRRRPADVRPRRPRTGEGIAGYESRIAGSRGAANLSGGGRSTSSGACRKHFM